MSHQIKHVGKCPGCGDVVQEVILESMPIIEGAHELWQGVSYLCPNCNAILGVSNDPTSLTKGMVSEIKDLIRTEIKKQL